MTFFLKECTNIFSSEGGKLLAESIGINFIGKIPIDPKLAECCENGISFLDKFPESSSLQSLNNFVDKLLSSNQTTNTNNNNVEKMDED